MREWKSQSHVKWYCKYHIVFSPKYRKKAMFGSLRRELYTIVPGDPTQERGSRRGGPPEKNALTSFAGVVSMLTSASSSAFDGW